MNWRKLSAALTLATGMLWSAADSRACPFCSAVSQTLSEKISTSDVAVLCELVDSPPTSSDLRDPALAVSNEALEAVKSTFRIVKVYRGEPLFRSGQTFKALYYGKAPPGTKCLATGLEPKAIQWGLPQELSPRMVDYIEQVLKLPATGADRLHFFDDYLEDAETSLQDDAANEFAQADYAALGALHGRLNHERLVRWIQNPAVPETRRRLYFVLLGICDDPKDVPLLEAMIRSGDAAQMRGLDALLACYLTLDGPRGLPLVEDSFLKKKTADFTQTLAAIMAIRFHVQQGDVIPRQRAIISLRYMLDRPELADLVIPDLARWEDWDSLERLVTLFKEAPQEWRYDNRVSVIKFLQACPLPEAKTRLEELSKLDPEASRRAASYFAYGGSTPMKSKPAVKKRPAPKPAGGESEAKPTVAVPAVGPTDKTTAKTAATLRMIDDFKVDAGGQIETAASNKTTATSDPAKTVGPPLESPHPSGSTPGNAPATAMTTSVSSGALQPAQAADRAQGKVAPGGYRMSASWLRVCVTGAAVLVAAVLMLIMWMILRLPSPGGRSKAAPDST